MGPEGHLVELRRQRRCRAFLAVGGGEIVGYGWLSEGAEWIGEIRLEITPAAGEAYIWNCVTLPAHRRTGIFTTLLISIAGRLQADGFSRVWIASAGGAEKALANAGFARVLEVAEARLAGLRRLAVKPAAGAAEDAVAAARAVLSLPSLQLGRRPAARRH